jgi:hypothetical protein
MTVPPPAIFGMEAYRLLAALIYAIECIICHYVTNMKIS